MLRRPDDAGCDPLADAESDEAALRERIECIAEPTTVAEVEDFFRLLAQILLDVYAARRLPRHLGNSPPPSGAEGWPDPQEAEGQALRHLEEAG